MVNSETVTPETHPDSPVVGCYFGAYSGLTRGTAIYLCDSYDPRLGYWMTQIQDPSDRKNVSERAIGNTYHQAFDREDHWYVSAWNARVPITIQVFYQDGAGCVIGRCVGENPLPWQGVRLSVEHWADRALAQAALDTGEWTKRIYEYKKESYSRVDGKSLDDLGSELRAVFEAYPEYSDPDYGDTKFKTMVEKFASDDFYHCHYVAKRFNELKGK